MFVRAQAGLRVQEMPQRVIRALTVRAVPSLVLPGLLRNQDLHQPDAQLPA